MVENQLQFCVPRERHCVDVGGRVNAHLRKRSAWMQNESQKSEDFFHDIKSCERKIDVRKTIFYMHDVEMRDKLPLHLETFKQACIIPELL